MDRQNFIDKFVIDRMQVKTKTVYFEGQNCDLQMRFKEAHMFFPLFKESMRKTAEG